MKARKTLKNQALIQEVVSHISQRFVATVPDIKKVCILQQLGGLVLNNGLRRR